MENVILLPIVTKYKKQMILTHSEVNPVLNRKVIKFLHMLYMIGTKYIENIVKKFRLLTVNFEYIYHIEASYNDHL